LLVQNVTFRSQTSTTASSAPARFYQTWLVKPNSIYVGIAHIAFSALQSRVVEGVHRNAALSLWAHISQERFQTALSVTRSTR